jgi:hypothetical protein
MASFEHLVDTKTWPGANTNAFWSLCERIDDLFTLESQDESTGTRAEYIFSNEKDGTLLKAPFDGLYNLYVDSWSNAILEEGLLLFNGKVIEKVEGPEINFDTFDEGSPFPLGLMTPNDELRLILKFASPTFIPNTVGSARMMRFTWKTTTEPFVITTSCNSALMYDGHQIRAVSHLEDDADGPSVSSLLKEVAASPTPEALAALLRNGH